MGLIWVIQNNLPISMFILQSHVRNHFFPCEVTYAHSGAEDTDISWWRGRGGIILPSTSDTAATHGHLPLHPAACCGDIPLQRGLVLGNAGILKGMMLVEQNQGG